MIGTMWDVFDKESPAITKHFYKKLMELGRTLHGCSRGAPLHPPTLQETTWAGEVGHVRTYWCLMTRLRFCFWLSGWLRASQAVHDACQVPEPATQEQPASGSQIWSLLVVEQKEARRWAVLSLHSKDLRTAELGLINECIAISIRHYGDTTSMQVVPLTFRFLGPSPAKSVGCISNCRVKRNVATHAVGFSWTGVREAYQECWGVLEVLGAGGAGVAGVGCWGGWGG